MIIVKTSSSSKARIEAPVTDAARRTLRVVVEPPGGQWSTPAVQLTRAGTALRPSV